MDGCGQTFKLYPTYRKHATSTHKQIFDAQPLDEESEADGLEVPVTDQTTAVQAHESTASTSNAVSEAVNSESSPKNTDAVNQLSLPMLRWKEGRKLPEATLSVIANDIIDYLDVFKEELSQSTTSLFSKLSTQHGRNKAWQDQLTFVLRKSIRLQGAAGKDETYAYVPLLDNLQTILRKNDFFSQNAADGSKPEDLLADVVDGDIYSSHKFFPGNRPANRIMLQFYLDEFEICNPIGSKRGIHKLTAVYFAVLNASPQKCTKVSNIHLAIMAPSASVKKYGLSVVLKPLLDDVRILEQKGVCVNKTSLFGTVLFVTGDNLACHQTGGF